MHLSMVPSSVCSSQDKLGIHKNVQYTQKSHFICTMWVDIGHLWTPRHPLGPEITDYIRSLHLLTRIMRKFCVNHNHSPPTHMSMHTIFFMLLSANFILADQR